MALRMTLKAMMRFLFPHQNFKGPLMRAFVLWVPSEQGHKEP